MSDQGKTEQHPKLGIDWQGLRRKAKDVKGSIESALAKDPFTGFLNKVAGIQAVEAEIKRQRRKQTTLTVAMLDLDGFKNINDTFGHSEGDRAILNTARVIRDTIRDTDQASRYGGDEFLIILPDTSKEGAEEVSRRIEENLLRNPLFVQFRSKINVGLSYGVAEYSPGISANELISDADSKLYQEKQSRKAA